MLFIKSTLLSVSTLLLSSTAAFTPQEAPVVETEYCYSVTITLGIAGTGAEVEVSACGNSPSQGLFRLGQAVRFAYASAEQ